jgi:hypothetical protein
MASKLLGRMACPECAFAHAHIKIKTDKEDARPYRHCPECGSQYYARNQHQADLLMARIAAPTDTQTPTQTAPKTQTPTPPAPPVPEQKYKMVFGVKVPV